MTGYLDGWLEWGRPEREACPDKPARVLKVSTSQIKLAKACPRKWYLKYDRGLKPLLKEEREDYLRKGDAIHQALEAYHSGKDIDAVHEVIRKALKADDAFDFGGGFGAVPYTPLEEVAWALGFFNAYVAYDRVRKDVLLGKRVEVEREFPRDDEIEALTLGIAHDKEGPVRVVLSGRWDGFEDTSVVEHKTVSTLSHVTPDDLVLDEQVSAMCWAASRLKGFPVLDVVYNLLCKPQIKFRPQNNKALRAENEHEYARRVFDHCLNAPGKFFERMQVSRTEEMLELWRKETLALVQFLLSNDPDTVWAANQGSWGGPCRNCVFHDLCAVWHLPARREQTMTAMYSTRDEREKETTASE